MRDGQFSRDTLRRIAVRYLGETAGERYLSHSGNGMVVIRLVPGDLRTWDFADDTELFGAA